MEKFLENALLTPEIAFLGLGILLSLFLQSAYQIMCNRDYDDDDEDEDDQIIGLPGDRTDADFSTFPITDLKMVMVVRTDLKMGKGKIGAQCGHATLGAYSVVKKWAKSSTYWKKLLL